MNVLTHHKVIKKIKIFNNVINWRMFKDALLLNRGLDKEDLDFYEVGEVPFLLQKMDFVFTSETVIEFYTRETVTTYTSIFVPWNHVPKDSYEIVYSPTEIDNINFNLEQSEPENWREIPLKEVPFSGSTERILSTKTVLVTRLS